MLFYVEVTDLFCGELNYSYVHRFLVTAKSQLGAMQKLSRNYGLNFRMHHDYGFDSIYHITTKLTGVWITEYDNSCTIQTNCYKEEI